MKSIIRAIMVVMLTAFAFTAYGQDKNRADSVVFSTNIHCRNCVGRIEKNIPFEKGIKDDCTDLDSKKVTVYYDGKKTTVENIIKAFAKIKIEATPVTDKTAK